MHDPTEKDAELTRLTDDDMLALVQAGSRRLDRQIRRRDWRELIASAVVAVALTPAVFHGTPLTRGGALVTLGGLALIALQLRRARRAGGSGASDLSLPVTAALRAERQRLDVQIALLESVAWWYVAPLTVGSIVIVAGQRSRGGVWFSLGYAVFAVLLGWGVTVVNRRVVRRHLRPKRNELGALLTQLES